MTEVATVKPPAAPVPAPPKRPLLERVAITYFSGRSVRRPALVSATDAVHVINPEERSAMRRVEVAAISRAAAAGALSGLAAAVAELYANQVYPDAGAADLFSDVSLGSWGLIIGVTVVASILEILFLYWDILRSVHELARVAGLELFGRDRSTSDQALVDALARAALELPNPVDLTVGVNPHRESRKWALLLTSLMYKLKIGVTNFLLKLLVRRLLGRVVARSVLGLILPLVQVPVTAAWNAWVTFVVLREARLRAMGPSAVEEVVRVILDGVTLSPPGRLAMVRAVAAAIVRTEDQHPNLLRLLSAVSARAGDLGRAELDDVGEFLRGLPLLPREELAVTLKVLATACVVDGRLTGREAVLWKRACDAAGTDSQRDALDALRLAFVEGQADFIKVLGSFRV